jgi:hypothetical protein
MNPRRRLVRLVGASSAVSLTDNHGLPARRSVDQAGEVGLGFVDVKGFHGELHYD